MTISRNVLSKYKSNVFVETGTHTGTTTKIAHDIGFKKIYTIELSDHFYSLAKKNFAKYKNIKCIHGDSSDKLEEILSELNEPCVFWLDGHFNGGDTACGKDAVPLMKELDVIKAHSIKTHTILIDDLRLMGNSSEPIKEWHSLSIDDVKNKCLEINKEYKFSFENGFKNNDILVAQCV
jgi:hypothetical protein